MALVVKTRNARGKAEVDEGAIRAAWALLIDPASPTFVQELPTGIWEIVPPGNAEGVVVAASRLGGAKGTYWAINPFPGDHADTVHQGDMAGRRNLYIDVDPIKAPGHEDDNATDEEHEAARAVAAAIMAELTEKDWPAPVFVDSGNGYALFYLIDLPNTPHSKALLKRFLADLASRHVGVIIDPKVINANRVAKIPGTWARKGPHSEERPHRLCRVMWAPEKREVVTAEQIAEACGPDPTGATTPDPKPTPTNGTHTSGLKVRVSNPKDGRAYARTALENERAAVAAAPVGNRNQTYNNAVLKLAGLVAGGHIGRQEVEDSLKHEAKVAGLSDQEIAATWDSAWNAGYAEPRHPKNWEEPKPAAEAVPAGDTITIRADSITPRKVEWLWPKRIPLGKLTTFAGIGGLGKTFVILDIMARLSRGDGWPDTGEVCEQGQSLFLSGEDDPDDTLVPRLIECGAVLSRVRFLRFEVQDKWTMADLKTLDRAADEIGSDLRFVGIDPPSCFLGDTDDHKNAEVRALLSPLKSWASRRRLAVVFNTHFSKSGGAKVEAVQRVMASVAWVNAVRAAHAFAPDPEDHERVFFLPMKMNLARKKKGLAYKIVETKDDMAKVDWLGEVDVTADDAVNREKKKRRVDVARWLEELFANESELPSNDIWTAMEATTLNKRAVLSTKDEMGIKARQVHEDEGGQKWVWRWSPEDRQRWQERKGTKAEEESF